MLISTTYFGGRDLAFFVLTAFTTLLMTCMYKKKLNSVLGSADSRSFVSTFVTAMGDCKIVMGQVCFKVPRQFCAPVVEKSFRVVRQWLFNDGNGRGILPLTEGRLCARSTALPHHFLVASQALGYCTYSVQILLMYIL